MILDKTLKTLEFDKIMASVSAYAVLDCSKDYVLNEKPCENIQQANFSLDKTEEAHKLLFTHNCSGVYFFDDVSEFLIRADMGGTLINGELLKIAENLKGARILKTTILSVKDESLKIVPEIASRLYVNLDFEKEIASKIISEDEISDNASVNLARIRKDIRSINVAIREKLTSFMRGGNKYLQEGVITKRQDRYVVPVKSEYRSFVKGFIHDQSSSGATVFIEPEAVMELNNRLKGAMLDEYNEI
ncbi:MAG: endonuclease MutS2, partial [Clostridia bacterium]|nr:endonuclease MutS2 [Clostridia bacterium]